jgi:hypothetical protein
MKALIAFIGMAAVIIALIEFNERRKKRQSNSPQDGLAGEAGLTSNSEAVCDTACTDCSLLDICDKDKKTTI